MNYRYARIRFLVTSCVSPNYASSYRIGIRRNTTFFENFTYLIVEIHKYTLLLITAKYIKLTIFP
ncbi:hypothetical protein Cal7507_2623 [Calothrix sp. PCC 7507]|nr:hypothetical protein Cal7507_2623 [Calothrix sp. PCC 7507]